MDAALRYLGYSARSVREMERYLDGQNYGEVEIMQVVERLGELGYLDDRVFAADFIRTRLATKPVSRRHLSEQLRGHEIPAEIIEDALRTVDDETERQNALLVAQKYMRQYTGETPDLRMKRVVQRLAGRGFSYEDSRYAAEAALNAAQEP